MLQLSDNKISRLATQLPGNYFVNASDNKLVYSNFTADGYQLKEMSLIKQYERDRSIAI